MKPSCLILNLASITRFNYEELIPINFLPFYQRPIGQTGGRGVPVQRPVVIMVHTPGTERV